MENLDRLGIVGKVGHDPKLVRKYNALLELIGMGGMLMQFERWANDEDIRSIISDAEDNLYENGIPLPYKKEYQVMEVTEVRRVKIITALSPMEAKEIANDEGWENVFPVCDVEGRIVVNEL